jgi:hypothetical protein
MGRDVGRDGAWAGIGESRREKDESGRAAWDGSGAIP